MVLLNTVNKEVHDYLEIGMVKDFDEFERYFGYRPFKQAKSFILMAITDVELDDKFKKAYAKLKRIYNNENFPDFKNLVDKCLDHLKEKYKNEDIKLPSGKIVHGWNYFDYVKYGLTMTPNEIRKSKKLSLKNLEKEETLAK